MIPKVLIVDDEVDLEELLTQKFRKKLKKEEINLLFAHNGIEALKKIDENPDVDIVITDINMPQMDGITLLGKLNEEHPLIKTVVLSAYGDMENIRMAMNRGAFDFLNKPVNFEDLEITLERTFNFVQRLKENETLRVNAVRMIMEFDRKLAKFLDALPISVSVHKPDGSIFYLNQMGNKLLGNNISGDVRISQLSSIHQFYKAGTNDLYPADKLPLVLALKGERVQTEDLEIHLNGEIIPLEVIVAPIKDEKGEVTHAIATYQDITERNRSKQLLKNYSAELEQEVKERTEVLAITNLKLEKEIQEKESAMTVLKHTQIQLVHSEKMSGLGTLVAGVAHEINNPTNFVNGIAHNLHNSILELKSFIFELGGEEADKQFIEMFENRFNKIESSLMDITEGSERIKTIVQDLRTFSRLDEAERKTVDITQSIVSTLRLIRAKYKEEVEFICDFQDKRLIDCWPAQLNQVFMNIMINACQAIQEKQKLNGSKTPGKINIKTFEAGENREKMGFEFTDDGCGMTEDVKNRIFEPFFTTKDVGLGTGMGMSITYGILEKHHAVVNVKSEPGIGTTFKLYLPLVNIEENTINKERV